MDNILKEAKVQFRSQKQIQPVSALVSFDNDFECLKIAIKDEVESLELKIVEIKSVEARDEEGSTSCNILRLTLHNFLIYVLYFLDRETRNLYELIIYDLQCSIKPTVDESEDDIRLHSITALTVQIPLANELVNFQITLSNDKECTFNMKVPIDLSDGQKENVSDPTYNELNTLCNKAAYIGAQAKKEVETFMAVHRIHTIDAVSLVRFASAVALVNCLKYDTNSVIKEVEKYTLSEQLKLNPDDNLQQVLQLCNAEVATIGASLPLRLSMSNTTEAMNSQSFNCTAIAAFLNYYNNIQLELNNLQHTQAIMGEGDMS